MALKLLRNFSKVKTLKILKLIMFYPAKETRLIYWMNSNVKYFAQIRFYFYQNKIT